MRCCCDDHQRFEAGCRPCQDANLRRWREGQDVLPSSPLRTEADDAYVAHLVADLTDAGIEREIRTSQVAERCGRRLDDYLRASRAW